MKVIPENLLPLAEGDVGKVIGYEGDEGGMSKKYPLNWGVAGIVYKDQIYAGNYSCGMKFSQERFDKEPNAFQGVRPLKKPFFIDGFTSSKGWVNVIEVSLQYENFINVANPPTIFHDDEKYKTRIFAFVKKDDFNKFTDNLATLFCVSAFHETDLKERKRLTWAASTASAHHQLSTAIVNYFDYKKGKWHTGDAICRGDKTTYHECYAKLLEGKVPRLNGLEVYWE